MKIKRLSDAKIGEVCVIDKIDIIDKSLFEKLKNLGFLKGEKVEILKYNYGRTSLLIKVMGINCVVDKMVCEKVYVQYD